MGQVGMAVAQGPLLVTVLLLVSSGLHCFSSPAACPESCTCQRAPLLNCSSSGLSLAPQHIQDSVTDLDLSHNFLSSITLQQPHHNLRNVWLGNNTITHLSLCIDRGLRSQFLRDTKLRRLKPWSGRGCVSWAPTLQLLSVERNQLEQLPEGLEGSESLQVLQLAFNRISTLRPTDLSRLQQLKELYLQHNLIASLHSQMFQDLAQLRVLDLSFNMLTSIHPFMYLSLHTIGADVRLDGNRWQCDCRMRNLRRRMAYDSSRGLRTWNIVCASPSLVSGSDLLDLEEDDLNCFSAENKPELHQDVTINSGSEILLSCSTQDTLWWTPTSQSSVSQPQAGLLISDIKERDTGLYVCVSEEHEVLSVFNLQISKIGGTRRLTRSLPKNSQQITSQNTANKVGQERNVSQSNFTLAVCLSVFITFLVAFILGVLARPCIDVLWKRATNKKRSSAANSVSSIDQRQYENEAFSSGEEQEEITYRERRVTFSHVDFREENNVIYYDTVASENECEVAEEVTLKAGDSEGENTLKQTIGEDNQKNGRDRSDITGHTHEMKFEHIPDPEEVEERRSLSSSSDSSMSNVLMEDQMTQGDCTKARSPQIVEDSVQQRPNFSAVPQISVESNTEIPGFSSEPFADWSPHSNNTHPADLDVWQENEEQFDFSDSVRSTSNMSSSSSYVSDGEPTQYTVNSDQEEEKGDTKDKVTPDQTKRNLDVRAPSLSSDSSSSTDSEDETTHQQHTDRPGKVGISDLPYHESPTVSHLSKTQFPAIDLEHVPRIKRRLDIKAPSLDLVSSSSSEDEATYHTERLGKVAIAKLPLQKSESQNQSARWPTLDLENSPCINRRPEIKSPSPASDSSSSFDSEDETTHREESPVNEQAWWPVLDLGNITRIKRRLDIKGPSPPPDSLLSGGSRTDAMEGKQEEAKKICPNYSSSSSNDQKVDKVPSLPSDSSTSSDSEDETTRYTGRQRPEKVNILYKEPQAVSHDQDVRWPSLDLQHIGHIKRRLDIKTSLPPPDSSSSSNTEIMDIDKMPQINNQEQGKVHTTKIPFKGSEAEVHDLEKRWPALDLEKTTLIKRRLDIKISSTASDSSSHSDSEDEATCHIKKQEQGEIHMARPPVKTSQTYDQEARWPVLDLEHTTRIKRHLDIKALSPDFDLSAGSDSDSETADYTEKQRPLKVDTTELPLNDPDARWPALDLDHLPHIKKRLDIIAPCPDSSPSIKIVEDKMSQIKKHELGEVQITKLPIQECEPTRHDTETQWPALDLDQTVRIKRRLDIKAPSQDIVSSSSSDSDDEITNCVKRPEKGAINMARPPVTTSQKHDTGTQWPAVDLDQTIGIKRRLDIQASSTASNSSFSSDSDDEITDHTEKQRPAKLDTADIPLNDPDTRWPALDLQHLPPIKRRLDIKSPCPDLSSDIAEDKLTQIKKCEQAEAYITKLPFQDSKADRNDQETKWPALDLEHSIHIKRRLDIKAPSRDPDSSSSSDSEDETTHHTETPIKDNAVEIPLQKFGKSDDPEAQWPSLDLGNTTRIKRRLDIKGPSPSSDSLLSGGSMMYTIEKKREEANKISAYYSSSSSDEQEEAVESLNSPPDPRLPELSIRSSHTPVFNVSHSTKADHSIKLNKYTIITDDLIQRSDNSNTTPEINPELQSRWENMNLGISRFRKRLEITSHRSPPSVSSETDGKGWRGTSQQPVVTDKGPSENIIIKRETAEGEIRVALKSNTPKVAVDSDSVWQHPDPTNIPTDKREFDIKAPVRTESSSSSSSEDEAIHQSVPDLSLGVPRLKRRLNIKAPSPEHSNSPSSGSENENEVTRYTAKGSRFASNVSGVADNDSIITYKRLIMKSSSLPSDSFSLSDKAEMGTVAQESSSQADKNKSLVPRKLLSLSFDDVVKKKTSKRTAYVDLPPEIRWTGIGRHLSDLSSSKSSLDVDFSSLQPFPLAPPERAPPDSFNFPNIKSYSNIKPDREKEYVKPMHSYSALSATSVSLAPSRALDHLDDSTSNTNTILSVVPEERRERKGLNALKAMSSERRKWDTEDENLNSGSSLYHHPQGDGSFNSRRSEVEIKPLAKQPPTHLSSTSLIGRRAADVLYGFPSYRRQDAEDIEPPQEIPPPVPETLPPDEAVELTWSP